MQKCCLGKFCKNLNENYYSMQTSKTFHFILNRTRMSSKKHACSAWLTVDGKGTCLAPLCWVSWRVDIGGTKVLLCGQSWILRTLFLHTGQLKVPVIQRIWIKRLLLQYCANIWGKCDYIPCLLIEPEPKKKSKVNISNKIIISQFRLHQRPQHSGERGWWMALFPWQWIALRLTPAFWPSPRPVSLASQGKDFQSPSVLLSTGRTYSSKRPD